MSVILGGITLSPHLVLRGLNTSARVAMSQRRTIGGVLVVQTRPLVKGRQLTMQGENHFTLGQLSAIAELYGLGAAVSLVHPRGSFTVYITGIETDPAINYANPGDDAWYSATITMIEV